MPRVCPAPRSRVAGRGEQPAASGGRQSSGVAGPPAGLRPPASPSLAFPSGMGTAGPGRGRGARGHRRRAGAGRHGDGDRPARGPSPDLIMRALGATHLTDEAAPRRADRMAHDANRASATRFPCVPWPPPAAGSRGPGRGRPAAADRAAGPARRRATARAGQCSAQKPPGSPGRRGSAPCPPACAASARRPTRRVFEMFRLSAVITTLPVDIYLDGLPGRVPLAPGAAGATPATTGHGGPGMSARGAGRGSRAAPRAARAGRPGQADGPLASVTVAVCDCPLMSVQPMLIFWPGW